MLISTFVHPCGTATPVPTKNSWYVPAGVVAVEQAYHASMFLYLNRLFVTPVSVVEVVMEKSNGAAPVGSTAERGAVNSTGRALGWLLASCLVCVERGRGMAYSLGYT